MKHRALTLEVIQYLKRHAEFPQEKLLDEWAQANHPRGSMKSGEYAKLHKGEWVDDRHASIPVGYLMEPDGPKTDLKVVKVRAMFRQYLREHKGVDASALTVDQVMELVSVVPPLADDGFGMGMAVFRFIMTLYNPWENLRAIRSEHRVREAAAWICIDCGRQMKNNPKLPHAQALIEAQTRMGISLSEYQDWWVSIFRRNPECIVDVVGRVGRRRIVKAVTGSLPVTEAFYQRVQRGEVMPYRATPEDVCEGHSRFIVLEGYGPDPDLDRVNPGVGADLIMGMLCHLAGLCDVPLLGHNGTPLRVISFAGTPTSARRLEKFEFKPLDAYLPGTRIRVFERVMSWLDTGLTDTIWMGVWIGLVLRFRALRPRQPRAGERPAEPPLPETA